MKAATAIANRENIGVSPDRCNALAQSSREQTQHFFDLLVFPLALAAIIVAPRITAERYAVFVIQVERRNPDRDNPRAFGAFELHDAVPFPSGLWRRPLNCVLVRILAQVFDECGQKTAQFDSPWRQLRWIVVGGRV